jgi:hypothetical protein
LKKIDWKIQFRWVKAHVGIKGNELANTLAKETATNTDITECYKKAPRSVVLSELGAIREMAEGMGPNNKRSNHKRILPGSH